jgi:hypothetical protein
LPDHQKQSGIGSGLKFAQARLSAGMVEQIAGEAAVDTPMNILSRK